jgi:hypothetical protein
MEIITGITHQTAHQPEHRHRLVLLHHHRHVNLHLHQQVSQEDLLHRHDHQPHHQTGLRHQHPNQTILLRQHQDLIIHHLLLQAEAAEGELPEVAEAEDDN